MTAEHGDLIGEIGFALRRQLPREQYRIRYNHGQVRRSEGAWYVPDLFVVATDIERPTGHGRRRVLP
ncbi:MAG: hypothetical protein U0531_07340 [Dehalococcoidia bacterium]